MTLDSQKTVIIRPLGANERQILESVPGPASDEPKPKPEHSLVVVGQIGQRMIGTISAEKVWCVSNFWVERSLRGSGLAENLAQTIAAMNNEGLAEMLCTTNPHVELLAHRFGFIPVQGTLFRR